MDRVTVLNSGSNGNSVLIESDGDCLLVDAGLSGRETEKRMREMGADPERIKGILVSHEHGDHIKGASPISRKFAVPIITSLETLDAIEKRIPKIRHRIDIQLMEPIEVGGFTITVFPLMHDAVDPLGFSIETPAGGRVTISTDLGITTKQLEDLMKVSDVVVLEANHDLEMLINGPYPEELKWRIMSDIGHLSNGDCAAAIRRTMRDGTTAFLAHISKDNNTPELALDEVKGVMEENGKAVDIRLTYRDRATDWCVIGQE